MGKLTKRRQDCTNVKNTSLRSYQKPLSAWEQRLRLQKFGVSLSLRLSHIATAMLLRLRYKSISDFLACVFTYVIKQPLNRQLRDTGQNSLRIARVRLTPAIQGTGCSRYFCPCQTKILNLGSRGHVFEINV